VWWWCGGVDLEKFCVPTRLAALRPYIYMYESVGLAVENRIDDPHAARHGIPPISRVASLIYIYQANKEFA